MEEMNLYYPWNTAHVLKHEPELNSFNGYYTHSLFDLRYDAIMLCKTSKDLQLVVDHYLKYHPFGIVFIEGDESIIPNGIQRVRVSHESELTGAGQRLYNIITI
jgi:hypothetical protein